MVRRLLFSLFFLLGCSSDPEPSGSSGGSSAARVCTPGATQECTGPGACKGGQSCAFDGSGWGPCDCGGGGESGSSGQAGASGFPSGGSGQAGSGTAGSGTAGSGTAGSGTAGSGTAGSGTAGSAGSGTAGSGTAGSGTAGEGGQSGADCGSKGAECQSCCDAAYPGFEKDFATDLVGCACFGACVAECGDICNGANSGPVCNGCLNEKFGSGECALDSCASAGCKAFSACVLGCP